jgi:uncharacterized membrane protein
MRPSRRLSLDLLRGIIMVIMTVDHVRDYFHHGSIGASPENLATTTPFLFFTRWITHFCAPGFALLAGLGIGLWSRRHPGESLSRYLLTRGFWLIFLELTAMRLALNFNIAWRYPFALLVFWSLGASMVAMSALVHLPRRALLALSLIIIAGHNLLDPIQASQFGEWAWVWNLIHQAGFVPIAGSGLLVAYPILAWIGVMAAGFCLSEVFTWPAERRQRFLLQLGLAATALFLVLRFSNLYGDPLPWSPQPTFTFTILSFLRCLKYPPSLCYLLMTLGPFLIAMSLLDKHAQNAQSFLISIGRTPMFYFLGHFALIHFLGAAMASLRYGRFDFFWTPIPTLTGFNEVYPKDFGYDLWVTYLVWPMVVALMYPLCTALAAHKERNRSAWVSYL